MAHHRASADRDGGHAVNVADGGWVVELRNGSEWECYDAPHEMYQAACRAADNLKLKSPYLRVRLVRHVSVDV